MDNFYRWLAYRLPRRVVHWAAIRLMAEATSGKYGHTIVPSLPITEAIKRWSEK